MAASETTRRTITLIAPDARNMASWASFCAFVGGAGAYLSGASADEVMATTAKSAIAGGVFGALTSLHRVEIEV